MSAAESFKKYNLDLIKLPDGFHIELYAEIPNARQMTVSPSGILYVGTREGDKVHAVKKNADGSTSVFPVVSGMKEPNGVAFKDGSLYYATVSTIYRLDSIESKLANPPKPVVVYDQLPTKEWHGQKFIAFGPDGKLYIPIGGPCNVCAIDSPFASINRMNADGTGFETYARGVRNSVGFDWSPDSKELWFTDNGRDEMGDDMPSDELNYAPKPGMHFGFPYCHQGDTMDPKFGAGKSPSDFTPPAYKLGAHVASLGMRFYTGSMFPATYKNQIFIAEHGSWNRSKKSGYRVVLCHLEGSKIVQMEPFATGWLRPDEDVTGRVVDVQVAPDGALFVSDDMRGAVYRIYYQKP